MSSPDGFGKQLKLFEFGPDLSHLRLRAERLLEENRMSPHTLLAYSHSWRNFERWCVSAGRTALPTTEDSVALFVTWCLEEKHSRMETVKLALSAIKWRHRCAGLPSPIPQMGGQVRVLIRSVTRQRCEESRGKKPITPDQVRAICQSLSREPSPLELRDCALLLVGFCSGCRGSELAGLQLADAAFVAKGLTLRIRRSKIDQTGKGRLVGLPAGSSALTCPVRALRAWVRARGDWPGPLFCRFSAEQELLHAPIRTEAVCAAIKRLLKRIGVDPAPYGAHSLRAGLATAAAEAGASENSIMRRAGWKSVNTVLRYIRPAQAFGADPLAGVL